MSKYAYLILVLIVLILGCVSAAFKDSGVYVLDPPNQNLRGHSSDGSDDKPLSICNPTPVPSPGSGFRYPCVTHELGSYRALLDEINRLEKALISCQQGN